MTQVVSPITTESVLELSKLSPAGEGMSSLLAGADDDHD